MIAVASGEAKGRAFLAEAEKLGAAAGPRSCGPI